MKTTRRTGYAYKGERTPPLRQQEEALLDAGCEVLFVDKAPSRDERGDMLKALEPGDTVVVCASFLLGSGAADTSEIVRQIGEKGCALEVFGFAGKVYTDATEIKQFAEEALKASRRSNADCLVATRDRSGPLSKAEKLTPEQWRTVRFILQYDGRGKQEMAVRYCAEICGVKLDRHVLARRMAKEARETRGSE